MVRALVGVWPFAGCRIDEIRRLDLDCVTWDEGTDEQSGQTYPICLLRVPQNKTSGPFTKPVERLTNGVGGGSRDLSKIYCRCGSCWRPGSISTFEKPEETRCRSPSPAPADDPFDEELDLDPDLGEALDLAVDNPGDHWGRRYRWPDPTTASAAV